MDNRTLILAVSFGTRYKESRDLAIGAIEEDIAKAFPGCEVRRAFTSRFVIDKLKECEGLETDHITEALERAAEEGITVLAVQPTFLVKGQEYKELAAVLKRYEGRFGRTVLGDPLFSGNADLDAAVKAVTEKMAVYDDGQTAICFMGHGTEEEANYVYTGMQEKLRRAGYRNYYIGTMEARPALEDILAALEKSGIYRKVVLSPLMLAAGKHVRDEMAGDREGSWKRVMQSHGYAVECLLEGLGQIPAVRDIYVEHVRAALPADGSITEKLAEIPIL